MIFNANVPKEQEIDEIVYEEISDLNFRIEELEKLKDEVDFLKDEIERINDRV